MISNAMRAFKYDCKLAHLAWTGETRDVVDNIDRRIALYTIVAGKAIALIALGLAIGFGIAAMVTAISPYIAVALVAIALVSVLISYKAEIYYAVSKLKIDDEVIIDENAAIDL